MPLVWASRLLDAPLPERVAGSDLTPPLLARAAASGVRVLLLGGGPGVAARARERLRAELPSLDVDHAAPWVDDIEAAAAAIDVGDRDLVLVGMGAPKQELLAHALWKRSPRTVFLGVGATLDFLAGTQPRAPRWMSRAGLEWLYRLGREPRRLWRRYLVRDPRFVSIVLRQLRRAS
jgi:N-acetylglucosaminyldiphosphoundecaprenol N-acetyl-beta-D-mannosaminyltransferase